jgi:hypothetical protein
MARKKSKKRRVRRKTRKSRSRSRKGRKGRRRRNPGNFVKPTPSEAQKHLDFWAKKDVTTAAGITLGMKAPYVGELKTETAVKLAKIRFNEARQTANWYLDTVWKGGGPGYAEHLSVHEAYKEAQGAWKAAKKAGTKVPYPIKPSTPASLGRGGNFRPVSKKRAEAYLKSSFRFNHRKAYKSTKKYTIGQLGTDSVESWVGLIRKVKGESPLSRGLLGARLAEAVTIVGAEQAAVLFRKAQTAAIAHEKKLADKKAKTDAANKKRWEKQAADLQAKKDKVDAKLATVASAARRRRARKSKRRTRRRNPITRRRRNPAKRRKAKRGRKKLRRRSKAKRGRRKAKRGRKKLRRRSKAKRGRRKAKRGRKKLRRRKAKRGRRKAKRGRKARRKTRRRRR